MSKTNYLEKKVLDHVTGNTAFTQPSALYVKLHTGDPGEDATANAATETRRMAVTFAAATLGAGTAVSSSQVQWTNVAATETYSYASLWDAATSGNPLYSGALTTPVAVTIAGTFTIASGSLTLSED